MVVRPDLGGHCLDDDLSSVGQRQTRGRTGRHAAVQIGMTDDRGTERLRDGRTHRFRRFGPRGSRCERHAASYAGRHRRLDPNACHGRDPFKISLLAPGIQSDAP